FPGLLELPPAPRGPGALLWKVQFRHLRRYLLDRLGLLRGAAVEGHARIDPVHPARRPPDETVPRQPAKGLPDLLSADSELFGDLFLGGPDDAAALLGAQEMVEHVVLGRGQPQVRQLRRELTRGLVVAAADEVVFGPPALDDQALAGAEADGLHARFLRADRGGAVSTLHRLLGQAQ